MTTSSSSVPARVTRPGARPADVLSLSALVMVAPGAVFLPHVGLAVLVLVACLVMRLRTLPEPTAPSRHPGRPVAEAGLRWAGTTSALEGVAPALGAPMLLIDSLRPWWFLLLLGVVSLHLTGFLVWWFRWVDVAAVPLAWGAVVVCAAGRVSASWRTGWAVSGWVMGTAVLIYLAALTVGRQSVLSENVGLSIVSKKGGITCCRSKKACTGE